MNYFKAHDEMAEDVNIPALEKKLLEAQEHLSEEYRAVTNPYLDRIQRAEEGIRETVLDRQRTMVLHGIEATYSKPRKSTSWKGVAMTFDPPDELIEEHSKVGSPSVRIKVQKIQNE